MEAISNRKRKLRERELSTEQKAHFKKLRKEQKKRRKRRAYQKKHEAAEDKKKNVQATDFRPRQVERKELQRKDSRGKMMVSAALKLNQETAKKSKAAAGDKRLTQAAKSTATKSNSGSDLKELKNVKRITGAKSIGSGTFGTCYPGMFRNIRVVVKEYKERIRQDDESRTLKMLQREARHEARVLKELGDHPGLPLLFGVSTEKIPVSIVLKFHGDGEESLTIYKAAKSKTVNEKKDWNDILCETADALEHIHRCGYVHNDLKSNNVVLETREDERLHPVIIDFGKSTKFINAKIPVAKPQHTRELYKNNYVAPELVNGTGKPSIASDVFSLAFLIKSVYSILKLKDMPITVKKGLSKSATDRPPISILKLALSADE